VKYTGTLVPLSLYTTLGGQLTIYDTISTRLGLLARAIAIENRTTALCIVYQASSSDQGGNNGLCSKHVLFVSWSSWAGEMNRTVQLQRPYFCSRVFAEMLKFRLSGEQTEKGFAVIHRQKTTVLLSVHN
jgi:hypothetical protein